MCKNTHFIRIKNQGPSRRCLQLYKTCTVLIFGRKMKPLFVTAEWCFYHFPTGACVLSIIVMTYVMRECLLATVAADGGDGLADEDLPQQWRALQHRSVTEQVQAEAKAPAVRDLHQDTHRPAVQYNHRFADRFSVYMCVSTEWSL